MRCSVFGCNNSNQGGSATTSINYHTFPKESAVLKQWLDLCGRIDKINPNTARMCSIHFVEEDYQLDTLLAYYGINRRFKKLKNGAVPTQHLPRQQQWEGETDRRRMRNKNKIAKESPEFFLINILKTNNDIEINPSNQRLKKQQEEEAAQGIFHDIQEQETSGPLLNIKEEISIDESVLEDYHIPKLETFENESVDTTDDVDPLSLSYMEIESRCSNKNESTNLINIIPKLETFENASEDMVNVEEDIIFPRMQNQPVQETRILRSTLKNNTNFSSSSSNTSRNRKRKLSDEDSRVEDHDFPSREDYVDYAMYVAARLKNSKQSDSAISIAKEKIELILCDLDKGLFENLMAVPFS